MTDEASPIMSSSYNLERWDSRAEWPLAGVAVVFLVLYSVQVLAQPPGLTHSLLDGIMYALWAAFAIDYVARLILADQRTQWFFRHLLDLAIVAIPFLRPLRMLRLVVIVGALQKAFGDANRGRIVIFTAFSVVLMVYAASLTVLDAERSAPGAHITNFGDAVWWACTTITTVGYGDYEPITPLGRLIAVLLMVGGIALIGMVTATVATWIIQRVAEQDSAHQAATAAQIDELRSEIAQLTNIIAAQHNDRGITRLGVAARRRPRWRASSAWAMRR
jgi:voltage-gated potassium channel